MQQNPKPVNIEAQYRTNVIIWLAMLFSQFMFLVLIFFAKPELYNFSELERAKFEIPPVVIALIFASLMTVAMSFVMKAKFLKTAVEQQKTEMVQTALIVALALCEAASLFGVVSAFAFNFRYFFAFMAIGILGFLLHFPRREHYIAASFKSFNQ